MSCVAKELTENKWGKTLPKFFPGNSACISKSKLFNELGHSALGHPSTMKLEHVIRHRYTTMCKHEETVYLSPKCEAGTQPLATALARLAAESVLRLADKARYKEVSMNFPEMCRRSSCKGKSGGDR